MKSFCLFIITQILVNIYGQAPGTTVILVPQNQGAAQPASQPFNAANNFFNAQYFENLNAQRPVALTGFNTAVRPAVVQPANAAILPGTTVIQPALQPAPGQPITIIRPALPPAAQELNPVPLQTGAAPVVETNVEATTSSADAAAAAGAGAGAAQLTTAASVPKAAGQKGRVETNIMAFQINSTDFSSDANTISVASNNNATYELKVRIMVDPNPMNGSVEVPTEHMNGTAGFGTVYKGFYNPQNNGKVDVKKSVYLDVCSTLPGSVVMDFAVLNGTGAVMGQFACRVPLENGWSVARSEAPWSSTGQCDSGVISNTYSFRVWHQSLQHYIDTGACNPSGISVVQQ